MAAITKTKICNMALGHLGIGKELTDVDTDATEESASCLMYYEHAVKSMLREWRWPFATKVAVMFWQGDDPDQEWDYAYMYPADCLKIRKIQSGVRLDTNDTREPYRVVRGGHGTDLDGICLSQTPSGAGNLTMAGVFTQSSAYTATEGRIINITSSADDSSRQFTITGSDRDGDALVEVVTGPNTTTVSTTNYFMTITSIAVDAATAGAITVGVGASYGKEIYTDCEPETNNGIDVGPVMEYTLNVTDAFRFDYDFAIALSFKLAAMIAPRITGGDSFNLAGRSQELFDRAEEIARQSAAAEEQQDPRPDAELIRVRY